MDNRARWLLSILDSIRTDSAVKKVLPEAVTIRLPNDLTYEELCLWQKEVRGDTVGIASGIVGKIIMEAL